MSPLSKSKGLKARFSDFSSPISKNKGNFKGGAKDLSVAKSISTSSGDLSVAEGSTAANQRKAAW
jgi:hypothetical protein